MAVLVSDDKLIAFDSIKPSLKRAKLATKELGSMNQLIWLEKKKRSIESFHFGVSRAMFN